MSHRIFLHRNYTRNLNWKKEQGTLENYKDVMRSCREKIRRAKTQLELNMVTAIKGDKKCFYNHICNTERTKKNLCPSVDVGRDIITKEEEKAKVPNTFFVSVFKSKTNCYQDTWALSWKTGMGNRMKPQ